ncbi:hypothetical protein ACPFP2_09225 [Micromonospora citrea]|uniref:hypothetical protein n=1 Tax=Micromonospora citrea TaxID=47855 RepID=UPI003C48FA95
MRRLAEGIGYRVLSRFLPTATAAAGVCGCVPNDCWCRSGTTRCCCKADCVTVTCWCPAGGCR